MKLLDMITEQFDLIWDTPNGVSPWILNEELISKMKKSGCYRINLAIESGVQEVLDEIINKPVHLDKIPELIEIIKKYDLEYATFLVIGNISENRIETKDEIKRSFRFIRKLGVVPHVSLLTAYPGSEVLEVAKKKGYLVKGFTWDDLSIKKTQLVTPEWTPEELLELTKKEILKTKLYIYFSSPKLQLQLVKKMFTEPRDFFRKLFSFSRQIFALNTR